MSESFCRTARLEIFRIKAYYDFRFRVRQFPFNPGYLTSVSASKSRDIKIFPFKTNFRLIQGPFKTGFTVYYYPAAVRTSGFVLSFHFE